MAFSPKKTHQKKEPIYVFACRYGNKVDIADSMLTFKCAISKELPTFTYFNFFWGGVAITERMLWNTNEYEIYVCSFY